MIKDLFGNLVDETNNNLVFSPASDPRPAKEIFMPPKELLNELSKNLEYHTEADLIAHFEFCYQFAKKYRLYYINNKGKEVCPPPVQKIFSSEKIYKKDWTNFYAVLLYYRNLHYFVDEMSGAERRVLEQVIENHYMTVYDVEQKLGEKATHLVKRSYYSEYDELLPKLSLWYDKRTLVGVNGYGRRYVDHIFLKRGMRSHLLRALHPDWFSVKKIDEILSDMDLLVYNNERDIHTIFPMIRVMFRTRQIDFGTSKCTATTIKAVAKMTAVREFFQTNKKEGERLAASLFTNIYCLDASEYGVGDFAVEDDIKSMWVDVSQEPEYFPALILSHITGFRKPQMANCTCEDLCLDIMAILRKWGEDNKWMDVKSICHAVRNVTNDSEYNCAWLNAYDFEKMKLNNSYDRKDIYAADIITELTYPFIKGYIFMMAVFGMAEIAYRKEPAPGDTCFYDTLKYVRLTPLGKYALGMTKQYEKPKADSGVSKLFELYEDNLMVKALGAVNPYESVLNNMGTPISKHLYKVSYESFLSGCTCKSDVTNRINLFRDYICQQPPANWEQFFKAMEDRSKPMKAPTKKYSLLQIPSDNKELQRILLTDPTIRKYSLKAEGFILLVETANKSKVVDALKRYGYLL